ncbi:phosphonopyruvate decarboxylase [Paraglaciecola sp. MB-3u-78]|uniref:phosphonopyruvate decarboxylase n=1 Tax=Paraglaciecola sp. MB-3u-78 TaxID=2058332 RepID=UPI000C333E01|nr:phosphonopyruvate decarboxylase [Paraglaciecola sp. MB-3u-78]PKH00835.1 phosphonopyruvate decarboxylase [Paraglaciecola sp. MB-3u-78]
MINPRGFCDGLGKYGIEFFCGVPDSLLKNLCAYIDDNFSADQHIITANEGNAVGLAMGRFLGSHKPAAVYMQNSGLGNAINPLTSLADPQVYSIPMLLVIGWRGEPGIKDEPQHVMQGQITEQQLSIMNIPFVVMDSQSDSDAVLAPLLDTMNAHSRPVAVLIKKATFSAFKSVNQLPSVYSLVREDALNTLLSSFGSDDIVVSTTGKTSREVFELRQQRGEPASDFLTVGGMGHTSSIAMGVALAAPKRRVIAIDGDGSMLMHMGALPIIGHHSSSNLVHIVLNNQCHESVGGQPTVAGEIDIEKLAMASGYKAYFCASDQKSITKTWSDIAVNSGPIFFEIKIAIGSREGLGRPTSSPIENKQQFMRHAGSL